MLTRASSLACAAVLLLSAAACSTDPEVAKQEYVKSGDRYVEQEKYDEAIIQYRNAIQIDPRFGEARFRLAEAYTAIGDGASAAREYVRAADLMPDDTRAQASATFVLLRSGRFEDARTRAEKALDRHPGNSDLQIALGAALAGLKDFDAAIAELEEAARLDPRPEVFTTLGATQLAGGRQEDAEAAFRRAVEMAPESVSAHVALASFLMTAGRTADAEQSLRRALELDPTHEVANRGLAFLLISTRRVNEAEPYLKTLADNDSQRGGPAKIALAEYYITTGRAKDALAILEPLAKDQAASSRALTRIARIRYIQGDRAQAHEAIDEVLQREPTNVPALLTKSRFLTAERKPVEALELAEAAVAANPSSAEARYIAGQLYAAVRRRDEAANAYREVLRLNPRAVAAQVQLSRLMLAEGDFREALSVAEGARRTAPGNPAVQVALARTLIANGRTARAEQLLADLARRFPDSAEVWSARGALGLARRNLREARQSFEKAHELAPADLSALNGLTWVDLAEKKPADARTRIEAQLQKTPDHPALLVMASKTYLALGEAQLAEQALTKAISVDASQFEAYALLAGIYVRQRRLAEARETFDRVAEQNPTAVGAMTMAAMTCAMEGDRAEARRRYERILQLDPRAGVAANNLAYMYATDGGNLDLALQLAQTAKAQLPDLPQVNDTLGWIYHKKGLSTLAVPPLEASVKGDPDNPVYRYHLGLAYASSGRIADAKEALNQALTLNPEFADAPQARAALEGL